MFALAKTDSGITFLQSQLKNKRMFASANSSQFELLIPSIRNDYNVLAFLRH